MAIIVIIVIVVAIIFWLIGEAIKVVGTILTLGFLPSGIHNLSNMLSDTGSHRMFDGNIGTVALIPLVEHLINYIAVLIVNTIDFLCWFVSLIPFVNMLLYLVYTAPDLDLLLTLTHRNFITHSALNPLFLVYIGLAAIIIRLVGMLSKKVSTALMFILGIIGFSFVGHLLADSVPMDWKGFALIKVGFFGGMNLFSLPGILSKLWLLVNAFLSSLLVLKACVIEGE